MKEAEPQILFDSISSQFSLSIFVQQFLLHATFPLFVPYFFYRHGWTFFYAQNFQISHLGTFFFGWIIPIMYYVMIAGAILALDDVLSFIAVPIVLRLIHISMVSLKYATLSPSEYRRIMGTAQRHNGMPKREDIRRIHIYQRQLQLVSGWINISPTIIEYEVLTAAASLGLDIHQGNFVIPSPETNNLAATQLLRWQALLSAADPMSRASQCVQQEDGSFHVPLQAFCVAVVHYCNLQFSKTANVIILLITLLHASIPIMVCDQPFSQYCYAGKVAIALSIILNVIYYYILLSFIHSAYMNLVRRCRFVTVMHSMLRLVDADLNIKFRIGSTDRDDIPPEVQHIEPHMVQSILRRNAKYNPPDIGYSSPSTNGNDLEKKLLSCDHRASHASIFAVADIDIERDVPMICPKYATNIYNWNKCRMILQRFGSRIRFRLDIYIGLVALLLVTFLLFRVVEVLMSSHPAEMLSSSYSIQTLFTVVVCSLAFAAYIFLGYIVNMRMKFHEYNLGAWLVHLEERHFRKNCAIKKELLHDAVVAARSTLHAIEAMDKVEHVKILGLTADSKLSLYIVSTLFFFGTLIIQYAHQGGL